MDEGGSGSDDDEWYARMEQAAPVEEEDYILPQHHQTVTSQVDAILSDDEYLNMYGHEDSSSIAEEGSVVWQTFLRNDVADLPAVDPTLPIARVDSTSGLLLIKQFLFSHIPASLKLFTAVCSFSSLSPSTRTGQDILTDSIAHPSFVLLRTRRGNEVEVSIFSPISNVLSMSLVQHVIEILSHGSDSIMFTGCEQVLAHTLSDALSRRSFHLAFDEKAIMVALMSNTPSIIRTIATCATLPSGYAYYELRYANFDHQ